VPSMLDSSEVKVFCPTWWRWRTSEAQGRDRPRGWAWKKRGAKLRVDGQEPDRRRERRTSQPIVTKSISIKSAERRSGDRAGKAVELTSGDLRGCPGNGTEEVGRRPDRRAEVSRGHSRARAWRPERLEGE